MKVLYVTPSYSIRWGGPSKVVHDLSKILSSKGLEIDILTTYKNDEALYPIPEKVNLIRLKRSKLSKLWTCFSVEIIRFLKENAYKYDLIHIHELWHFPHFVSYIMHRVIPYVVTIHGGLDEWCLNHKWFKKRIFSFLIQRKILERANTIHVLTSEEKESVLKYVGKFLHNIVIIPNGLDLREFENLPRKGTFEKRHTLLHDKRYILFLGRINVVKGLDILVNVFKNLSYEYPDLYLVIAGPDNEGYGEKIKNWLKNNGLFHRVIFTGILTGKEKLSALVDAELFVLPSYSECFPMGVVEAMACGIPVVISNKVGIYREVEGNKAGIVVETNPENLYKGIKILIDNEGLKRKIAENGKRLVKEYYDINKVADIMIEAYEKALRAA